jgi:hypothetical protein
MLTKFIVWVGVAFLIVAASLYFESVRDERLHPQPLSLPVSLTSGLIRTPEFTADIDSWVYDIAIDFDTKVDQPRLDCLLGGEAGLDRCDGASNLIDISWELFDGGRIVADGNSGSTSGIMVEPGVRYERTIGTFKAQKGHHYTLVLHVNRDASELNSANPNIVVQISRGFWEDRVIGIALGKLFAGISGLLGLTILAGSFAVRRFKRRKPRSGFVVDR